jgi:hypothetical protein
MSYHLIIVPDNGDSAVETFATFAQAATRAATIIRWYEPAWPAPAIIDRLKAGVTLTYHDHSNLRIEKAKS